MWQQMQNWYKITNPWSKKSNYTSGILKVTETVNTILFAVLFTLAYMVIKPSFIIVSLTHLNEFTILAVLMEERFCYFFEMIFRFLHVPRHAATKMDTRVKNCCSWNGR